MKCKICEREAIETGLCTYHKLAEERLRVSFEGWSRAYGTISWAQYLKKIGKLPDVGIWVKEVVKSKPPKNAR